LMCLIIKQISPPFRLLKYGHFVDILDKFDQIGGYCSG